MTSQSRTHNSQPQKQSYRQQVNLVKNYVRNHLDAPLSVESLAAVAGFSAYHFYCIFSAMVRESVGSYVRRLRLERAAQQLAHSMRSANLMMISTKMNSGAA